MWNEPSPQQQAENTNLYFQKDIPWELVYSYGSVQAGIGDGSSSTDILYINSGTWHWIFPYVNVDTLMPHPQPYEIV